MNRYFGYARISTPQQSIERQIRNILAAYPQSEIIREVFTGTKFQGRREFEKLLKKLNLPEKLSARAMLEVLNALYTRAELFELAASAEE